jgi:hypothetical protein
MTAGSHIPTLETAQLNLRAPQMGNVVPINRHPAAEALQ